MSLALVLVLPAMPAAAAPPVPVAEREANGTVGTATALPPDCVAVGGGDISPIGDVDFWSFQASAGDRVWVFVDTAPSSTGTDSVLQLLGPDGTTVIDADDDDGPGLTSMIAGTAVTATGRHYLRINEFANNDTITPYRVFVAVTSQADGEAEPNAPDPQAGPPCARSISGAIEPAGDSDRYELELEADDRLLVSVDDDPERDTVRTDALITLEAPDGSTLTTTSTQGFAFDIATSGTHVLKVDGLSGAGAYGLVAASVGLEAESEANGVAAAADPLPAGCFASGAGAIAPIGDVDFWSFQGNAGQHVWAFIDTAPSAAGTDSVLELLAPNGTSLLEQDDDDGPGLTSVIAGHTLGTGGTHFLRINEFANNGTIDPYLSHLSVTTGSEDELEPNDADPQRGPDCETRVRGQLDSATDLDRFALDLRAGELLFVAVDRDPERDSVQTAVQTRLNDPSAATVASTTTSAFTFRAPSSGLYELILQPTASGGSYAVHISTGEPPPGTSIDSGPGEGDTITDPAPAFGFSSDEPGATFECRVDAEPFAACMSPTTAAGLADGSHTFEVRAIDEGRPDPSPAARSFTVDTAAPQTAIDAGPAEGGVSTTRTPSFRFSSSEPGSGFECRLDGAGFSPCDSPRALAPLADGAHTFEVRATDPAGNTDPTPVARNFTVDATPPRTSIDSGPGQGGMLTSRTPTFTFSSNEPGSSFECRLDGTAFAPCASPTRLPRLGDGPHTFQVRATDPAGNADPSPATRRFDVEAGSPELRVSGRSRQSVRRIVIAVACADEPCTVSAGGAVTATLPAKAASPAAARKRKFRLRPVRRALEAGERTRIRLRLRANRRNVRKVRALLRSGWRARATVRVQATDGARQTTTRRRVIRVRR